MMKALCLAVLLPSLAYAAPEDGNAFVTRWLAAQNADDFAAYDALYAPRMTGVRRSGSRVVKLDRAGWMRDRARMFKKPMTVSATDVRANEGGGVVVVELVQAFAQGSYNDRGKKRLVLVRSGDKLQISREEMLSSQLEQRAATSASQLERFAWMMSGWMILDEEMKSDLTTGEPREEGRRGSVEVLSKQIAPNELGELAAWRGKKVDVYRDDGSVCTGQLEMPRAFVAADTLFDVTHALGQKGASDKTKRRQAWALLSPRIGALVRGCEGVFARVAALERAPLAPPLHDVDGTLRARAIQALRKLPAYEAAQARYFEETKAKSGRWDVDAPKAKAEIKDASVVVRGKTFHIVTITASAGQNDGCGDERYAEEVSALFWVEGNKLRLDRVGSVDIAAFGDLDGDGKPEIMYTSDAPSAAYLDCPC